MTFILADSGPIDLASHCFAISAVCKEVKVTWEDETTPYRKKNIGNKVLAALHKGQKQQEKKSTKTQDYLTKQQPNHAYVFKKDNLKHVHVIS